MTRTQELQAQRAMLFDAADRARQERAAHPTSETRAKAVQAQMELMRFDEAHAEELYAM